MANREKKAEVSDTNTLKQRLGDLASAEPDGLLPFRTVMTEALYGEGGYYSSGRASVGRSGDFFTSVSVGALFGSLLARHVLDSWQAQGRPARFSLVEQGANDGRLMADILDALPALNPELAASVEPWIIEPLDHLEETQRTQLLKQSGVHWVARLSDFPTDMPPGLFYSNELVDAFPVDRIRRNSDATDWEEQCLRSDDGQLVWKELTTPELRKLAAHVDSLIDAPSGYETELHQPARDWIAEVANSSFQGDMLIVDYGFAEDDYYHPSRTCGTLQAYQNHKSVDIEADTLGEVDLTAHVEFSGLVRESEAHGFQLTGFANQSAFLTRLAAPWLLELEKDGTPIAPEQLRQFQTLTHPGMMGGKFFALGLRSKALPVTDQHLSGFSDGSGRTGGEHLCSPPANS